MSPKNLKDYLDEAEDDEMPDIYPHDTGDEVHLFGDTYAVKDYIRAMKFKWDDHGKKWYFPYDRIKAFESEEDFKKALSEFVIEVSPDAGLILAQLYASTFEPNLIVEYDGNLWSPPFNSAWTEKGFTLFQHQEEAIRYSLSRKGSLMAHEMGLGKTFSAIFAHMALREILQEVKGPMICVVPAFLKLTWWRAVEDLGLTPAIYPKPLTTGITNPETGKRTRRRKYPQPKNIFKADAIIMSYEGMGVGNCLYKKFIDKEPIAQMMMDSPRTLVFDECQYIKSNTPRKKSQRAKKGFILAEINRKNGGRAIFLTGTPIMNRPTDIFAVFSFLNTKDFADYYAFSERYMDGHREQIYVKGGGGATRNVWKEGAPRNLRELSKKMRLDMHRVTKDVALGKDFPKKVRIKVDSAELRIQMPPPIRNIMGYISKRKRLLSNAKVEATAALAATNYPCIVFTDYRSSVEGSPEGRPGLPELLEAEDLRVGVIKGGMSDSRRMDVVDGLQNGDLDVVVAVTSAAGAGLTLHKAKAAFFNDLPWTPGAIKQAEDRIHRIGLEHDVSVFFNVAADDSFDQRLFQLVEEKSLIADAIIDENFDDATLATHSVQKEMALWLMKQKPGKFDWCAPKDWTSDHPDYQEED